MTKYKNIEDLKSKTACYFIMYHLGCKVEYLRELQEKLENFIFLEDKHVIAKSFIIGSKKFEFNPEKYLVSEIIK